MVVLLSAATRALVGAVKPALVNVISVADLSRWRSEAASTTDFAGYEVVAESLERLLHDTRQDNSSRARALEQALWMESASVFTLAAAGALLLLTKGLG